MRVAMEGSSLGGGSGQRGLGTYVGKLLAGMAAVPDFDVVVLAAKGASTPVGMDRVRTVRVANHRVGPVVQDLLLPWEISRAHADLVHCPAQEVPRTCSVPWVQTLHDLTPLVISSPLFAADARRWRRIGPRLRSAAAVITGSESAAQQGIELLGIDPGRVHVIPHGVAPDFAPRGGPQPENPYLLMCSSWGPHKGVQELAAVFDLLVDSGLPHRLHIVGRNDAWMQQHLEQDLAGSRHRDRIDVLGWVPDLVAEYSGASALLVTTRAEGFGLPGAEAMATGTPVVSFDNTSLPEVVGEDSPLLVPDGDVAAFAQVTADLLASPQLWEQERRRGLERAAAFSWEESVRRHLDVYRSVVS